MTVKESISTIGMTKEQWLLARKKGIGGSDVSAIIGINKWKTAYQLWKEKVSDEIIEQKENEAMEMGTRLEPVIAEKYSEVSGYKVVNDNKIRFHPEYPFLLANIDRIIQGDKRGPGVLEIKTASKLAFDKWTESIPLIYYCQFQHYLSVTGYTWGEFAILVDGRYFHRLPLERDEDYIQKQNEALVKWWNTYVVNNVPPELTADELAFVEVKTGSSVEADKFISDTFQELAKCKASIKDKEEEKKRLEDSIKLFIGDNEQLTINGEIACTWKSRDSERIDSKKLKALHPEVYKEVSKVTTSRYFLTKE